MVQMKAVNDQYDPNGGRFSGTRSSADALKPVAEYLATMDNASSSNTHPMWDAEYARQESPRRVWDKYSPPSMGYNNIAAPGNAIVEYPTSGFLYNSSEDLARANILKYYDRWSRRGGQGLSGIMVGGAKIIFADSVSHGRMTDTELARVSGAVDGARLPKETFYAMQAAQSEAPTVNIMGHWTYPAGTTKNVYVMANTQQVQLLTYTASGTLIHDYGFGTQANQFEFGFANVQWQAGKIKAIGFNNGMQVATQEIVSAGAPARIKLTPILGPQGFIADGSDVAMFDVEVTDANGIRCPTDEARIDFTYSGQAKWLGGYNSGIQNSIFQNYLNTEAGINRVFVRSTRSAGSFTLTATRSGLTSATATINSSAFTVTNGLTLTMPQGYSVTLGTEPSAGVPPTITPVGPSPTPTTVPVSNDVMTNFAYTGTDGSAISPPMPLAHVVHGAQAGMQVYVDNAATFPTLPSYLAGGAYIQAFQPGNLAAYAIDGNTTTRWGAADGTFPQWLKIDLGQKDTIGGYQLNWYNNAARSYKYKIELSDDDVTYNLSVDKQANTQMGISNDRIVSPNTRAGRYVRITVTGSSAGWASLFEIKVMGVPGAGSITPTVTPTRTNTPTSPTLTPTRTNTPIGPSPTPTRTNTPAPPTLTPTRTNTPATGSNLALNKPVTCSPTPQYACANAVDGNLCTRWASAQGVDPQWIQIDLGAPQSISHVILRWETAYGKAYQVQTSNDGTTWATIYSTTTRDAGGDDLTGLTR